MRRRSGGYTHQNGTITASDISSVRLVTVQSSRSSFHSDKGNTHAHSSHDVEDDNSSPRFLSRYSSFHFTRPNSSDACTGPQSSELAPSARRDTEHRDIPLKNSHAITGTSQSSLFTLPQAVSLFPSISSGLAYFSSQRASLKARTDSEPTLGWSRHSSISGASVESDHKKLIPSIQTTEKFTNKWPRPQPLRAPNLNSSTKNRRHRKLLIQEAISELEEGYSLGLDKIDRWTRFKWCLMISVVTVLCYGSGAMICAILTWFRTWNHADVMYVADNDILILITLAASILMFTAILGVTGTLLNSRPILATYTLLLWPALISMLAVGYISYKRYAFSLDRKLNFSWSQYYTPLGRLMIQSSLRCCGYYDPLHEATTTNKCYPRTPLPGCKGKLYRFERENLSLIWSTAFSLVSLHLINILVALLCSNHVTNVFGKRITPKQYRLSEQDLKTDAEKIKSYIVEQVRPIYSRASSSTVFREDREERMSLLKDAARLA
ncbi:Tetraspanin family-domain-containing protein [Lentinula aff. detonsa]|nr:Tetraspanin family-domain-containing protein [Lentinula aff. detonsa]